MKERMKIIAAGHICLDLIPIFPQMHPKSVSEVLSLGKLVKMDGIEFHLGGSAANTGLGFKKLGADVRILGKIGADMLGDIVQSELKKHGVTRGLICENTSRTSYSVALSIPGIDRIFLHDPGANDSYTASDIPEEELENANLFHFGYPPLMREMYRNEGEELLALFQRVKEKKIPVSLDMAAVDENSEAGKVDWTCILKKILPYVDIFLPSIEELLFMLDREKYHKKLEQADGRDIVEVIDIETDVKPLAKYLLNWGSKIVVIKCGSAGIYLETGKEEKLMKFAEEVSAINPKKWSNQAIFETCYEPEQICSGTGAGDTCISAFLMAMLKGFSPKECLQLAAAQGASCVEAYDAFGGLRTMEELQEKIKAGWKKVNTR